jgi:DNA modification methylase/DNA-directed RNA polymerase subunit RPC12/RpoP
VTITKPYTCLDCNTPGEGHPRRKRCPECSARRWLKTHPLSARTARRGRGYAGRAHTVLKRRGVNLAGQIIPANRLAHVDFWHGQVDRNLLARALGKWGLLLDGEDEEAIRLRFGIGCAGGDQSKTARALCSTPMRVRQRILRGMALLRDCCYSPPDLQPEQCADPTFEAVYARTLQLSALGDLSDREREVLERRFVGEQTLEEVGAAFGCTREGVRQIEAKALRRVRRRLVGEGTYNEALEELPMIPDDRLAFMLKRCGIRHEDVAARAGVTKSCWRRAKVSEKWEWEGYGVLYQGDALEVMAELPDGCADLVLTDPPYGHNNQDGDLIHIIHGFPGGLLRGTPNDPRPITNDGPEANDLFRAALPEFRRLLKPGACCCCCCGGGGPDPQFARWSLWLDEVLDFKMAVVWDKGPMGMGWHYRRSYEMMLVAQKPGAKCKWYDTTQRIENVIRPGAYGIRKIIPSAAQHPTQKPVALFEHFIRLHTLPGELVLDPFAGHATCAVAAIRNDREFLCVECEPKHCDLSRKRIELAIRARQDALPGLEPEPRQKARQLSLSE